MAAGARLELGQARLHVEQVTPATELLVHARQLAERLDVVGRELHDLREHGDERRVALDVLPVHRGHLGEHGEARLGVLRIDPFELSAQQIGERVPARRLAIEPLERLARVEVGRALPQEHPVVLDGLGGARPFLREAPDLLGERALRRSRLHRALGVHEDLRQTRALTPLAAVGAEELEGHLVRRLLAPEPLEERLGRLRLVAHLPVDHRHLDDHPRIGLLGREQLLLVERGQLVPALGAGEVVDQRAGRFLVTRCQVDDLRVGLSCLLRQRELVLVETGEAEQLRHPLLARQLGDDAVEEPGHRLPVVATDENALEEESAAAIPRIERDRAIKETFDRRDAGGRLLLRRRRPAASVAPKVLRRAHEESALEAGGARRLRLLQILLRQIGPAGARLRSSVDDLRGGAIVGQQRAQTLARGDGARVVEEVLVVDAGELAEERRLVGGAVHASRLELEEPRDRVALPAGWRAPSERSRAA